MHKKSSSSGFHILAFCFWPFAFSLVFGSCSLFDNTKLEQQRAELARLKEETEKLRQEAEALRQQNQKVDQEREACNRAVSSFRAGRKTSDSEAAIVAYKEGLTLCPNDDVAHNELGEIYVKLGRKAEATAEFQEALRINPDFARARKNLEAVR
jgi:tetratricopeptide (TPR) repeat protein